MFCCHGNVSLKNILSFFIFDMCKTGVDHQQFKLIINMHNCFFFSLKFLLFLKMMFSGKFKIV